MSSSVQSGLYFVESLLQGTRLLLNDPVQLVLLKLA